MKQSRGVACLLAAGTVLAVLVLWQKDHVDLRPGPENLAIAPKSSPEPDKLPPAGDEPMRVDALRSCVVYFVDASTSAPISAHVAFSREARLYYSHDIVNSSDKSGRLEISGVDHGREFVAFASTYVTKKFEIEPSTTELRVQMDKGARLVVSCRNALGAPVAGVSIAVSASVLPDSLPDAAGAWPGDGGKALHLGLSDSRGDVVFTSLGAGRHTIRGERRNAIVRLADPHDAQVDLVAAGTSQALVTVSQLLGFRVRPIGGTCYAIRLVDQNARYGGVDARDMQSLVEVQHGVQRAWRSGIFSDVWIESPESPQLESQVEVEALFSEQGWSRGSISVRRMDDPTVVDLQFTMGQEPCRGAWIAPSGNVLWPIRVYSESIGSTLYVDSEDRIWLPEGTYRISDYFGNELAASPLIVPGGGKISCECSYGDKVAIDVVAKTMDGQSPSWCCLWVASRMAFEQHGEAALKPISAQHGRRAVLVSRGSDLVVQGALLGRERATARITASESVTTVPLVLPW